MNEGVMRVYMCQVSVCTIRARVCAHYQLCPHIHVLTWMWLCMYVYVCMYICRYVCIYVYVYIYIYLYMCIYTYMWVRFIPIHTHLCMYMYEEYALIHVCISACTHRHTYLWLLLIRRHHPRG